MTHLSLQLKAPPGMLVPPGMLTDPGKLTYPAVLYPTVSAIVPGSLTNPLLTQGDEEVCLFRICVIPGKYPALAQAHHITQQGSITRTHGGVCKQG